MSESNSELSTTSKVKDENHVVEEMQNSATGEEHLTADIGLQILAGSIVDFDPEGDESRPFE